MLVHRDYDFYKYLSLRPLLTTLRMGNSYSRTPEARTLMARLPLVFRIRSNVPYKNNPIPADIIVFGMISGDFRFDIDNGMLCLSSLESPL